jgi:cytidylate kinase
MVRLITVEREYGSGGAEFARSLADHLGWTLLDRCLVEEVAAEAGVSTRLAEECDEQLDPWYHRVSKVFWQGSMERMPGSDIDQSAFDAERMAHLQRERVTRAAEEGHCVIIGRGAASILTTFPGAFHVYVFASMKRKVKWYQEQFPDKAANAEEEILAIDRRRAAYIRQFYNHDWADRRLYHMMVDACMGPEAMMGAVLAGAGLLGHAQEAKTGAAVRA